MEWQPGPRRLRRRSCAAAPTVAPSRGVRGESHRAVQRGRADVARGGMRRHRRPSSSATADALETGLDQLPIGIARGENRPFTVAPGRKPGLGAAPRLPERRRVDDEVADDREPREAARRRGYLPREACTDTRGQGGRRRESRTCRTWRRGTSSGSRSTRPHVGAQGGHRGPWRARRPPARSAGGRRRRCARSRPTAPSQIDLIVQEDHSRIRITAVKANTSIRV